MLIVHTETIQQRQDVAFAVLVENHPLEAYAQFPDRTIDYIATLLPTLSRQQIVAAVTEILTEMQHKTKTL